MFGLSLFAALCGFVLLVIWRWTGQRAWFTLAIFWMLYAGYEFMIFKRVWCTGDCNIRVDFLLILLPLLGRTLWVISAAAVRWVKRRRQGVG
jgi:hypothetical protein